MAETASKSILTLLRRGPVLTLLRKVPVAAQPAVVTSEEYFREAGVMFTNDIFRNDFYGLYVPVTGEAEVAVHSHEKALQSYRIIRELRGKDVISVSQFKAFLAAHRSFLVAHPNIPEQLLIFYLIGSIGRNGKRAVRADWDAASGGWFGDAYSVSIPYRWLPGRRVVSQV